MSSTPTIRITGPESLLSALPHLLGYQPTDSVLGIALHDRRLGMVERIDTPPIDQIDGMLAATVPPMLRERPTAVLVIGYETVTGQAVEAVEALASALAAAGVDVPAPVLVTPTGWRHLDCTCCPTGGHPLPAAEHPVGLELSAATGSAPAPCRDDLAQRLTPTRSRRDGRCRVRAHHPRAGRGRHGCRPRVEPGPHGRHPHHGPARSRPRPRGRGPDPQHRDGVPGRAAVPPVHGHHAL
jgi:hypothetical protein